MTSNPQDITHHSVAVVAHPDDETLWFSSILADVSHLVICYRDVPSRPKWSAGRTAVLTDYPLGNLTSLNLTEADVFWNIAWDRPVETEFGLSIDRNAGTAAIADYRANFAKLVDKLKAAVSGARNVITHNPWGEYGNAEHVQVYRALCALQHETGFDLWVTSYFSNKSAKLMLNTRGHMTDRCVTRPVNAALAGEIADLYKSNDCWTWYDDYRWPATESFYLTSQTPSDVRRPGTLRGLHLIDVGENANDRPGSRGPGRSRQLRRTIRRFLEGGKLRR